MSALLDVILPVFLVIGFGYVAVWKGYFSDSGVDGLMKFTQGFAIPCLLFRAISTLDLGQNFDLTLLGELLRRCSGWLCRRAARCALHLRTRLGRQRRHRLLLSVLKLAAAGAADHRTRLWRRPRLRQTMPSSRSIRRFAMASGSPRWRSPAIAAAISLHLPGKVLKAMFSNALIVGIIAGISW